MMPLLAPRAFALLQAAAPAPEVLAYRFDEVKRTVYLQPGGPKGKEVKAVKGAPAASGDAVRTGWLGQTIISVPTRNSRFEIFADTQVQLASGEPGVLLVVQRGRIKAIFQALLDGHQEERRVAVPGALLAVRGTNYGVEVHKDGTTTLAVFEGVVEVIGQGPQTEPIRVKAGEWSTFGPGLAAKIETMRAQGFEERTWNQGMRPNGTMSSGPMAPGGAMKRGSPTGPGQPHM